MNELALFAGAGGGILGGKLLGWRTVCAVEFDPYAASVLVQRQNDGLLPPFPIWNDVRTFDGRPWRGIVDVVSGGFPCQDISAAGRGAGIAGERSGLWSEFARIIGEVRPRYAFVENSPILTSRGLGVVLGDLAALGFDARWGVLGASSIGAPHRRERIWIVAHAKSERCGEAREFRRDESTERLAGGSEGEDVANPNIIPGRQGRQGHASQEPPRRNADRGRERGNLRHPDRQGLALGQGQPGDDGAELATALGADWWATEPDVGRVANGVAARVDRLKALGNGQVPQCAAEAWRLLST